MKIELEVLLPTGDRDSVELIHALTWVKFQHSVGLEVLLERTRQELAVSENRVRAILQSGWRKVASLAREGKIEVWGKPLREPGCEGRAAWRSDKEQELIPAELRNCRHLSWPLDAYAGKPMSRLERYPDTYHGQWQRLSKQAADEFDFVRVSVGRAGLLTQFPIPKPRVVRQRASAAKVRRAAAAAIRTLKALSPEALEALSHEKIMPRLVHEHALSIRYNGEADALWKRIVDELPKLARRGPRPKSPTQ